MLPQWGMGTTLAWRDHPICGENRDWSAVSTRIRDRAEPFFEPGDPPGSEDSPRPFLDLWVSHQLGPFDFVRVSRGLRWHLSNRSDRIRGAPG